MVPRYIDEQELQAREDDILDHAMQILLEEGAAALTIDKLVSRVSYSKGTIYNHFSSKEDVLTAICNRMMSRKAELFGRVLEINTSARRKMTGIGFAYMVSVLIAPQHFTLIMNVKSEIFDKASQKRRDDHENLEQRLFGICIRVIQEALDNGELPKDSELNFEEIAFSFWATIFGTISLLMNGVTDCSIRKGLMLENRLLANGNLVMDGLGWSPVDLDKEGSEDDFIDYLKKTVYSEEIKQIRLTL